MFPSAPARLDCPVLSRMGEFYAPDILPGLQSVLGDLADLEIAFEREREAILQSPNDETRKRDMLDDLQSRHQARRSRHLQQLAILERRIASNFTQEPAPVEA